ncbi:MAG: hypothetical protein WCE62_03615, partial [Polyangiales bacterium]
ATGCTETYGSTSVTLSGKVTEYVPDSQAEGAPIAGVEVCQLATNNCTVTDEDGNYELPLLKNSDVAISHVKEGFGPVLIARSSGEENLVGGAVLATDAALATFASELGTPYPPVDTGFLTVTAFRGSVADGNGLAGVSYSLLGSNGRSYYMNDSGIPQSSLTATQMSGAGGFVEVEPVTVTIQLSGTAVNCTAAESWAAAASNAFTLPIGTGFSTQINVSCE